MTSIKGNSKILKDFKNQIFERFLHEVYPTKNRFFGDLLRKEIYQK